MRSGVKNGMLSRNPKFAARSNVCMGGQKNAWCMNFTRLVRCVMVCTLCAAWCGVVSAVGLSSVRGISQRPVFESRVPVRMVIGPSRTWQALAS